MTSSWWLWDLQYVTAVSCGTPPDGTNTADPTGSFVYQHTYNYTCNVGYETSNETMVVCGADEMFSPDPPVCTRKYMNILKYAIYKYTTTYAKQIYLAAVNVCLWMSQYIFGLLWYSLLCFCTVFGFDIHTTMVYSNCIPARLVRSHPGPVCGLVRAKEEWEPLWIGQRSRGDHWRPR